MVKLLPVLVYTAVFTNLGLRFNASPVNRYDTATRPLSLGISVQKAEASQLTEGTVLPIPVADPVRVLIPSIGVDSAVVPVSLNAARIVDTPGKEVGWYIKSAPLGAKGAIVLSGHFVAPDLKKGVFNELSSVNKGDRIEVKNSQGTAYTYEVFETEVVPTDQFPVRKFYGHKTEAQLHLVTCAGVFEPAAGTYSRRTLVYARLVP